MASRERITTITHFVELDGSPVSPACGDWSGGSAWTIFPGAVTCRECAGRLRATVRRRTVAAEPEARERIVG